MTEQLENVIKQHHLVPWLLNVMFNPDFSRIYVCFPENL